MSIFDRAKSSAQRMIAHFGNPTQIVFLRASLVADDAGGQVKTWETFKTVNGAVAPHSGGETIQHDGKANTSDCNFYCLHVDAGDVIATDRILFEGREYEITDVSNVAYAEGAVMFSTRVGDTI